MAALEPRAEGGIRLWHDARTVIITNNTVTESNTGIIVGGGNFYYSTGPNDYTTVYSNIVYDNKMGIAEQGWTGLNNSYRNNLVYRNSRYDWLLNNGIKHSGTVSAAPLFAGSSRAATPNLRPGAGSPAIGRASAAYAECTDFEGRPRNARRLRHRGLPALIDRSNQATRPLPAYMGRRPFFNGRRESMVKVNTPLSDIGMPFS